MVHDDAPLKFVQLIQLLRVSTMENYKAIWAQFKNEPVYRYKFVSSNFKGNFYYVFILNNDSGRRWLLDALPSAGTPVTLKFIKEKFLAGELMVPEFIQALVVALQMVTADLDTIQLTAVSKSNYTQNIVLQILPNLN